MDLLEWYARDRVDPPGGTLVVTRTAWAAKTLARLLWRRFERGEGWARADARHRLAGMDPRERGGAEATLERGGTAVLAVPASVLRELDFKFTNTVRTVYFGLPEDPRDVAEAEWRKRMDPRVRRAETVVIPFGELDLDTLARGLRVVRELLSAEPERLEVNPSNHYKALFTGAAKLLSPLLKGVRLTRLEEEALEAAGVLGAGGARHTALKRLWTRLHFYSYELIDSSRRLFKLPGVREMRGAGEAPVRRVAEELQPGCIDRVDATVVAALRGRRSGAYTEVVEYSLEEAFTSEAPPWLAGAVRAYRATRRSLGGDPDPWRDLEEGLLEARVELEARVPRRGFGLAEAAPVECVWLVYSRTPSTVTGRDGATRPRRRVLTVKPGARLLGSWRDYTYGLAAEGLHGHPEAPARLGLAVLMLYLRRVHGVPLGAVRLCLHALGEKRLLTAYEPSAAGLIGRLDWASIARGVSGFRPSSLDEALLARVDREAYAALESLGFDWGPGLEEARAAALLVASSLEASRRLARLKPSLPRPSRSHGIAGIAVVAHPVEARGLGRLVLAGLAYYDGSTSRAAVSLVDPRRGAPPRRLVDLEAWTLARVEYGGLTLATLDPRVDSAELARAGLRLLARLAESRAMSASKALAEALGVPYADPAWLEGLVDVGGAGPVRAVTIQGLARTLRRSPLSPESLKYRIPGKLEEYLRNLARLTYLAALLARLTREGAEA
ncbi:hypothetical protein [Stetteria hydrogenophila]